MHKFLIDDSNQPRFKSFMQANVKSLPKFREVVKFFGFEREGQSIEREFSGIIQTQVELLLRLILLPNCCDEIDCVVKCLSDCLEKHENWCTSEGMLQLQGHHLINL